MTVRGDKIGAGIGDWNHSLDSSFVDSVHLAMATPWREDATRGTTYFTHHGKQYFRAANGNVYKRVDPPHDR